MTNSMTPERKARVRRLTVDLTHKQYAILRMAAAKSDVNLSKFTRFALQRLIQEVMSGGPMDPVTRKAVITKRDQQWQAFLSGQGPHPMQGGL